MVPVAMTTWSALMVWEENSRETRRVCGSSKRASPQRISMLVAHHLFADDADLGADDLPATGDQVVHGDLGAVAVAVKAPLLDAGQVQHGFAQGFAGDGAGVGADAADDGVALDERDLLAELGGLDGGLLAGGTAADDDHVDVFHKGFLDEFHAPILGIIRGNLQPDWAQLNRKKTPARVRGRDRAQETSLPAARVVLSSMPLLYHRSGRCQTPRSGLPLLVAVVQRGRPFVIAVEGGSR